VSDNTNNLLLGLFLKYDFWESNHLLIGDQYFQGREQAHLLRIISEAHQQVQAGSNHQRGGGLVDG
jgi:hypothetical protein